MFRKTCFFVALAAAGLFVAGHGTRPVVAADAKEKSDAPFVHAVIFYLNKDAPADAASGLIADAHAMLAKIPSVRGVKAGRPAEKATPDVAKTDFQVGLLILLDNAEGLKTYLEHALHTEYVKKHGKNIDLTKLMVYDFVDAKK